MGAPSFAKFPGQVQTQGAYPWDPRSNVGAANSRYPNKESIAPEDRYEGMLTVDENGKLWMLKGGKTNADYLDILALFVTLASANAANGYAALDGNGKIDNSVIPSLAIGDTFVEDSQAAMLGLTTAEIGDICKRTDTGDTFILQSADYTLIGSWVDISSNFSGVETVNGKSGTNITLNQDEVPDGATYKRVTQAEKDSYAAKQAALGFDDVPTFQSTKWINSGKLFEFLKTIQSSVENKTWLGSDADGNNRFNLDAEDEGIDSVMVLTEGGVIQHEGVHFTVDAAKRYIEFNINPVDAQTYYLTYLSNIPIVSLTSVSVENVEGLLVDGMINPDYIESTASAPTIANAIDHNAPGVIAISFAAHFQQPVNLTHNITGLSLSGGTAPMEYKIVLTTDKDGDGNPRIFTPAPDWIGDGETYSVDDTVVVGNRIYKVPAGQSHDSSVDFATDLAAGKWKLHIRFDGDNMYFPSTDDEDILHIECISEDYYKITVSYGS